jgi:hypothetical protein
MRGEFRDADFLALQELVADPSAKRRSQNDWGVTPLPTHVTIM